MKRDHIGFSVFLVLLLLAPKVPLNLGGALPTMSGIGLGAFGLVFWSLLVPGHLLHLRVPPASISMLCMFALYALVVSIVSMQLGSVAYALQYAVYVIFGWVLLASYLQRAAHMGQLNVVVHILVIIGLVYALGVIVSVWTGPFYSHQVLWSARNWEGYFIQQGVGFSEGTNIAGAVLIVFCALLFFGIKGRLIIGCAFVALAALMLTISRGSIFGFALGVSALWGLDGFRLLVNGRFRKKMLITTLIFVGIVAFVLSLGLFALPSGDLVSAMVAGFGFGDYGLFQSESTRIEYWRSGLQTWMDGNIWQLLFGRGFRVSMSLSEYGTWLTSHNMYITVLGDFGVIGLLLFLGAFVGFIVPVALRIVRDDGNGLERACFVAIVGLLAHNMTEAFLYSPVLITLVLMLFRLKSVDYGRMVKRGYVRDRLSQKSWLFV